MNPTKMPSGVEQLDYWVAETTGSRVNPTKMPSGVEQREPWIEEIGRSK